MLCIKRHYIRFCMLERFKKSKVIFWVHWLVALIGHIFVVIIPIGLFRLLWNSYLDFWTKGLILGCLYMGLVYTVNHITSGDLGFCVLTDLENYYREKEGLPKASKRFIPRFYKKCKEIYELVFNKLKRLTSRFR